MSITTRTRSKVAALLQERGPALGLTVPHIRALYPAKAVRRSAVLEALADLEAMGKVAWRGERVRWTAPFTVERVLGEDARRIERDRAMDAAARATMGASLSSALVRRAAP